MKKTQKEEKKIIEEGEERKQERKNKSTNFLVLLRLKMTGNEEEFYDRSEIESPNDNSEAPCCDRISPDTLGW